MTLRALAPILAALAVAGCQPEERQATFDGQVRAYILAHPEVLREAAARLQEADRRRATAALNKMRSQLERDPRDFVANPAGKITVVQFFDYRCAYCKSAAPEVVKLIAENPDVRFVFKEFPIFGSVSDTAARMALTPQGKTKAMALYGAWMGDKALTDAALDRHLTRAGLDPTVVRLAALDSGIEKQIENTRALAKALKIDGTPTFIVGDVVVEGADIAGLRAAIRRVRSFAPTVERS
jgi:protein-disulfide isomerase